MFNKDSTVLCCAVEEKKLDILINSAGATWIPDRTTVDGFESIFATNHLGMSECYWSLCLIFILAHRSLKYDRLDGVVKTQTLL